MQLTTTVAKPNLARLRELTAQLEASDDDFNRFFSYSPDLMAIAGTDGFLRRVNDAWPKILGWTNRELSTREWVSLVHPDDDEAVAETLARLHTEEYERFYCRLQAKARHFIAVEFTATQWRDGCTNLIGRAIPDACQHCVAANPRTAWSAHACNRKNRE